MEIIRHKYWTPNVGKIERGASVIAGTLLVAHGLKQMGMKRKGWAGLGLAFLGTGFLRRGITGFCYTYQALGIRTAEKPEGRNVSVPYELGIRVDEAITINRPVAEVYAFWRNLENLAEFMEHVESVRPAGGNRSHWVAKGPGNRRMEWDAEIIHEEENRMIGWRSLEGSDVPNAGSVHFAEAAGGRGTEVRVELQYDPPGGTLGAYVAKLFGEEPSAQVHNDLQRLKTRLEAGVVPTTAGQPVGASGGEQEREHQRKSAQVVSASEESFPASDAPAYSH
jgi:uncharacterized membrane protein